MGVAGYHLDQGGRRFHAGFLSQGYAGVAFFFVLSGFVLTWTAPPRLAPRTFYRRRFARIYPAFLTATVFAILLGKAAGPKLLIPNLLMLQAWATNAQVIFGVAGVTWSMACETFFYACFPLILLLFRAARRTLAVVLAGAAWLEVCVGVTVILSRHDLVAQQVAYANPLVRSGEFVLGIVLATVVRAGWRLRIGVPAAVVLVLGSAAASRGFDVSFPLADVALLPSFALLLVACAEADLAGRRGLLPSRILVKTGQVSFAFYLLHALVIQQVIKHVHVSTPAVVVVALVAASAAAWIVHEAVERPAQRLLGPRTVRVPIAETANAG